VRCKSEVVIRQRSLATVSASGKARTALWCQVGAVSTQRFVWLEERQEEESKVRKAGTRFLNYLKGFFPV
jgi:hypothetical protein